MNMWVVHGTHLGFWLQARWGSPSSPKVTQGVCNQCCQPTRAPKWLIPACLRWKPKPSPEPGETWP